jgi:hypothetical protein
VETARTTLLPVAIGVVGARVAETGLFGDGRPELSAPQGAPGEGPAGPEALLRQAIPSGEMATVKGSPSISISRRIVLSSLVVMPIDTPDYLSRSTVGSRISGRGTGAGC